MTARAGSAFVVAILGAESTGKSTLAQQLAEAAQARGLRATWVPEFLREFCEAHGRTPRADEQAGIAAEQTRRIAQAGASHDLVVADTTALQTAVYSEIVFGDTGLYAAAAAQHQGAHLTLLTALDLPWQADGLQRDGAHVRQPVDTLLRRALLQAGCGFGVVGGIGPARVAQAQAQIDRGWRQHALGAASTSGRAPTGVDAASAAPPSATSTSTATSTATSTTDVDADTDACGHGRWGHVCARCGDGDCERRLFALARAERVDHKDGAD